MGIVPVREKSFIVRCPPTTSMNRPHSSVAASVSTSIRCRALPPAGKRLYTALTETCIWSRTPMAQAMKANTVTSRRGTSSAQESPVLKQYRSTTVSVTITIIARMDSCAMISMILWVR